MDRRHLIFRLKTLIFKRVLQEGSLGLGESYMDGWWECDRLDVFFTKVLRAGLEKQLPRH
jgi:cyclopropane-fatty-acyl-phospholipid synthase